MNKHIKRTLITLSILFIVPLTVYAATQWKGSKNVENIHNNLSRITVLIDDLRGENTNKDNTIKQIEKLIREQEKAIQDRDKQIDSLKKDIGKQGEDLEKAENKLKVVEDELDQAYEDVKQIEKVTDDMVEEMEE